jgi:hypothetical protein
MSCTRRNSMLQKPNTAPTGTPLGLVKGGSAKNARKM